MAKCRLVSLVGHNNALLSLLKGNGHCAGCIAHIRRNALRLLTPYALRGLGGKMGLDATNKWPGETQREWGTPIVMDVAVKRRVDEMWGTLGL